MSNRGCTNCGELNHSFKQCLAPITSHGIIAFRIVNGWNPSKVLAENESAITGLEQSGPIQFLMIQRRDSLGFVELMRGKYGLNDFTYITTQLKGMTVNERGRFLTLGFQQLWDDLWGSDRANIQYRQEKEMSRSKMEQLREFGIVDEKGVRRSLIDLFESFGPGWQTPEWGFPKGRRDPYETERACAFREMFEETGLRECDTQMIENLEPIQENFFGTNHIYYCHKYRIVYVKESVKVEFDPSNEHMRREIGNLGWFTLEEALQKIRPENVEKKEVLIRVSTILRNYCPFSFV
jgi:8-oxo-dGTP pyrophosphatase MutT (NUDIX family)